jgi:hypothetical protein
MRNTVPMRWMEQAEARQVLSAAQFERAPEAPWGARAGAAAAQLLPQLRSWLADRHPMGWPVAQLQPALVRRPTYRPTTLPRDDEGYSCTW